MSNLDLVISRRASGTPDRQEIERTYAHPCIKEDPAICNDGRRAKKCENITTAIIFMFSVVAFFVIILFGAANLNGIAVKAGGKITLFFDMIIRYTDIVTISCFVVAAIVWIAFTLVLFKNTPYFSIWGTITFPILEIAALINIILVNPTNMRSFLLCLTYLLAATILLIYLFFNRRYFRINAFYTQTGTAILFKHFGLLIIAALFLLSNIGTLCLTAKAVWFYLSVLGRGTFCDFVVFYIVFMFAWIVMFQIYLLQTIAAGVASSWFVTPPNTERNRTNAAIRRTLRYNLGTVALAALVNTILETVLIASLLFALKENVVVGTLCIPVICILCFFLGKTADYLFVMVAIKGCPLTRALLKKSMFHRSGNPVQSYILIQTLMAHNVSIGTWAVYKVGLNVFTASQAYFLALMFCCWVCTTLCVANSSILTMAVCFEKYSFAINSELEPTKRKHDELVAALKMKC